MRTRSAGAIGGVIGFALGVLLTAQFTSHAADLFEGAKVSHVGFVVRDVDKAAKQFGDAFGVELDGARIPDLAFPPGSGNKKARVKIRGFTKGNFRFELVQPLEGPSPHKAFLDKHGEGVQHFSFGTVKDPMATVKMLQAMGGNWSLGNDQAGYYYVDMPPPFSFSIEVARPGGPISSPR